MADRKVQVFFYGSFISLAVLEKAGLKKRAFAPASISGYELVIQPHATIVEGGDGIVYGILANMTHAELDSLYLNHIQSLTKAAYKPEAVLVSTRGGKIAPALVFICHNMEPGVADAAYVDTILKAAGSYGFPSWYVDRINSFRPNDD